MVLHAKLSDDHQLVIQHSTDGNWYLVLNGKCPLGGQPIRLSSFEDPRKDAYERATKHLRSKRWAASLKSFEELIWK